MVKDNNRNNRIARNTFFLYIRMGITTLVALYTTRVVLRVLGIEDFGIYNVVCGFVSMFGVLNTTLTNGINRFYNYELGRNNTKGLQKVYNTALLIQFGITILVLLFTEIIGIWYINHKMVIPIERLSTANWIFQFSLISLLLTIMQAPYNSAIMAYERMDYYAIVSIIDVMLKLFIVYLLPNASFDKLLLYGMLMLAISAINFLLYFLYAVLQFKALRISFTLDKPLLKQMLSFSGWSLLDPVAYTIRGQGCNMALNSFFGPKINTAYGISNQIAVALDQFSGNITLAFRPQIIQSYSNREFNRTKHLMCSMSKINYMLQLMLAIPIIFEINYILHVWLGEAFPSYTIPFTCLVLIMKTINTLNLPITTVIMAIGRIKKYMIISSLLVSFTLPITLLCLYLGSKPTSLFYTMIFITIINQVACIYILCHNFKYININEYYKTVLLPCIIQTLIVVTPAILISIILTETFSRLICNCFVSIIATVLSARYICLSKTEIRFIRDIINKKLHKK